MIKNTLNIILIIIAAICLVLFFCSITTSNGSISTERCIGNARSLSLALAIYAQDNGGLFPLSGYKHSSPIWMQSLKSSAASSKALRQNFKCPLDTSLAPTSYALGPDIGGRSLWKITRDRQAYTVILYESVNRHNGKHIIAYLDGHVDLSNKEKIKTSERKIH